jgi:hypothetical protein
MIAMILVGVVSTTLLASGNVIGVISAEGTFRLDSAAVSDHATLFEGDVIQTGATAPTVDLKNGGRIQLGPNSTAKFSGPQVELQQGIGEVASAKGFEVQARSLHIQPVDAASVARVEVRGDRTVLVAAYHAPVRVLSATGIVVANVAAGMTLSFDPQAGGNTSISGCLLTKGGKFIVVDPQNPRVLAEVRGNDVVTGQVGNQVTIAGTTIPGATSTIQGVQVVGETSLQQTAGKTAACVNAAKAVGADPVAGTAVNTTAKEAGKTGGKAAGAASSHTTAYVIAGIAVAGGAIGGIAASRGGKSGN